MAENATSLKISRRPVEIVVLPETPVRSTVVPVDEDDVELQVRDDAGPSVHDLARRICEMCTLSRTT